MPTSAPRRCTTTGCPHPAGPRGRCTTHEHQADRERNTRRATSLDIYRSKRWKKLRTQVLHEEPYCQTEGCGQPARHVDHRKRIEDGGAAYERSNLQALCHPHHSAKTANETGFGGRHD